ncbi:hypothetical protein [Pandoraea sp. SD6-2]|uniref:hypothetical protein n=1 Tax=Pandoraea sp. SD6-2 TaxID=1286093 RepID=UPI00033079E1|nr:hypothetical protein [Pandoraea sp. SD6-2]EON15337.1 hypothetical protein C266_02591 [Pandoraea sp. SD6-2]
MAYSEEVDFVPGSERGALHASHQPAEFPDMSGPRTMALADAALAGIYKMMKGRKARNAAAGATGWSAGSTLSEARTRSFA